MQTTSTLVAITSDAQPLGTLPRNLMTTDRVLQRWAVSTGSGLPSDEWDDTPKAKLPPLSDDVAIDVDQCVISSPTRTREIVTRWYKTPEPAEVIAGKLKISRSNLYIHRDLALNFMRWKFERCGNAELTRLIRAIDN